MYIERTKSSVTLNWKPPRNDGGCPVIGYYIEKKRHDEPAFTPANKEPCKDLTFTVENLFEFHTYEFRVKAFNEMGESDPSLPLTAVIQDDEGLFILWNDVCTVIFMLIKFEQVNKNIFFKL